MPTLDRRALLLEAVASLTRQTTDDWEAIVVDDGSTDGSFELLEAVSRKDPRIRPVRRPRGPTGAPACRNLGAERSRGRFLVFLDSDDVLAPHCLAQRTRFLAERPDLDFAVFPMLMFERDPGDRAVLWNTWHRRPCDEHCDLRRFLQGEDPPWQTAMPIWRKVAFERLGAWNEAASSWQDWELHVRALIAACRYELVALAPDCHGRHHEGSRISGTFFSPAVVARRIETVGSIIESLRGSRLAGSVWRPGLIRMLTSQAERAALHGAPIELSLGMLRQAHDLAPASVLRWGALERYVRIQGALARNGIPWLRGGLRLVARAARPRWFSDGRSYSNHRLSETAIAALRQGLAESGWPADVAWSRELTTPGRH